MQRWSSGDSQRQNQSRRMSKDELWELYCKQNPRFRDSKEVVTLKVSGLKKLFETTYDKAFSAGCSELRKSTENVKSLFDEMFGSGRKF